MQFKCMLLIVISLLISYPVYLWATYIDNSVTSGDAYGFTIGESKMMVYSKSAAQLNHMNDGLPSIFIRKEVKTKDENFGVDLGSKILVQTYLSKAGYTYFSNLDVWTFYFNGTNKDKLTLRFCENRLCEIYRHRKHFEIP